MKKIFLLLAILFRSLSICASIEIDGIYYSLNGSYAEVTNNPNKYTGNIIIPEEVKYENKVYTVNAIGIAAFQFCENLSAISLPKTIKKIDCNAFDGCSMLKSIIIPDSVERIEEFAFYRCAGIESIEIPNNVIYIGDGAFYECLCKSLKIGSGLKEIGVSPFYCKKLTSIIVDKDNKYFDSRDNCNALISTESDSLILGCLNTKIPNQIRVIGDQAFGGIEELTEIDIPNSVVTISVDAFNGTGLTILNLPCSIRIIRHGAFANCNGLESISLPEGIKEIGNYVFYYCGNLRQVDFPESVIFLGHHVFYGTPWENNQPEGIKYVGRIAYKYMGVMPENYQIDIKKGIIGIAGHAFSNSEGSISSVSFPEGLKFIGYGAFAYRFKGKDLVLPNSVEVLCDHCFQKCELTSIVLGDKMTTIGNYSFYSNNELSDVFCYAIEPPVFFNSDGQYTSIPRGFEEELTATLHVPVESVEKYKSAYCWKDFSHIVPLGDDDPQPTGLNPVNIDRRCENVWYDLKGHKLSSEPVIKGVYINNGKKIMK